MKKIRMLATIAVAAGALFTFQSALHAQTIGFKVGQTFSKLDAEDDDDVEQDFLKKFAGGGFIRFGLGGLGMQAELLAVTKGFKTSDEDADFGNAEASLKLDYIEVPVLLRFGLGSGTVSPYVMAGPTFSFETGCSFELESADFDGSVDCEDDNADLFKRKKFDLGATGVAGLEFKAGPGALLLEGRFTQGLTNISDEDSSGSIKNHSFAILAGYSFTLR
jgi:opacity protein-like surface antigen